MSASKKNKTTKIYQIATVLNSLYILYKEFNRDKVNYHVDVPLFGIRFRVDGYVGKNDGEWDIIQVYKHELRKTPNYIAIKVMWLLISKGYFAYIREMENGIGGRIFRTLLINEGWGTKIIEKRIELADKNGKKDTFKKTRMEVYKDMSVSRILSHYPGFFDYL